VVSKINVLDHILKLLHKFHIYVYDSYADFHVNVCIYSNIFMHICEVVSKNYFDVLDHILNFIYIYVYIYMYLYIYFEVYLCI
jgi:hypothetical protein